MPNTKAQPHELVLRGAIEALLDNAKKTSEAMQSALLSPRPVDLTSIIIGDLVVLMRSLAFLMDEILVSQGLEHAIHFKAVDKSKSNGVGEGLVKL